jgi:putative tryptophan/tyrosine transport system substrate-binding protein
MKIRCRLYGVLLTAVISVLFASAHAGASDRIAVVLSSKETPFEETLNGIRASLSKQDADADFEVIQLEGVAAKAGPALQQAKKNGTKLIVTLGSLATDAAVHEISDLPIVAALILRDDSLKKAPNLTGVALEFPLEIQIHWIQTLLPNAKTVGVVFNPEENQKRVDAAGRILSGKGMKLAAKEVRSQQDVTSAVEGLGKQADVVWGIADSVAFTSQMARNVLLLSFKNNVPVIGLSPAWVKAGALYSLEWDYADMGAQAGEMAAKILKGTAPSSIAPAPPRKVYYVLNLKTAQQMKITFTEKILKGAHQTF